MVKTPSKWPGLFIPQRYKALSGAFISLISSSIEESGMNKESQPCSDKIAISSSIDLG